jgi:hypothetical protein
MRHFLFEEKEYRYKPYFKRRRNQQQDSALALAKLLQRITPRSQKGSGGGIKNSGFKGGSRSVDVRQKCIVKMQYSNSIEAHRTQLKQYLSREGTDIDGERAKLYGTDSLEYQNNMVKRNFRIFLSPQSNNIDLTELSSRFVKKLEQQTGFSLFWQAANHYNTAHPHAHLLINGIDKNGKEVEIPRDIVKTFMREYARDICTSQIGNRTREDIALEKDKLLEAKRYTKLDETIKGLCNGTFRLDPARIISGNERVLTRLDNLRKMGLCTYADGSYKLSSRWEEDLRDNGRYNTYLAARSKLQYTNPANMKIFSGEHGTITGKVTKIYRTDDDASDNHAVIVEALDGKAYFVPLFKKPEMFTGRENKVFKDGKLTIVKEKSILKEGELVSIKTYESQRGRLTPSIFKREVGDIQREIKKHGHTGTLASEINQRKYGRKE